MANQAPKKSAFLACLSNGDSIKNACKVAGIARHTAYRWREEDEEFRKNWEDALEDGIERLEEEAFRRALDGSDTLLIFLLKAKRPSVYTERARLEHTGKDGGAIVIRPHFGEKDLGGD